jgi:hypothetical protein
VEERLSLAYDVVPCLLDDGEWTSSAGATGSCEVVALDVLGRALGAWTV